MDDVETTRRTDQSDRDRGRRYDGARGVTRLVATALVALAFGATLGCGADFEAADGLPEFEEPGAPASLEEFQQAEQHLENHDVDQARDVYADVLQQNPGHGKAAAGLAVTDLLLVLDTEEVDELLLNHLDAQGSIDANELLFAEEGLLYWASRGVRWDGEGEDYQGIRDLVADELPWSGDRLESTTAFVDGLDTPVGDGLRQLVSVANALDGIEANIETALQAPEFTRLYVPGEVLHDGNLALRIGRSELAALQAGLSIARGLVYFVAAYEHDWTLERAFGDWRTDPAADEYQPGFESIDYTVALLDDHLFRDVASPDRLAASRSRFRDGIGQLRQAIEYGLEEPTSTTLQWNEVDEDEAFEVHELLGAVDSSFDEPTTLPHTTPETTLDLRPLFEEEGRTLDAEIPWLVHESQLERTNGGTDDDQTGDDPLANWSLNDEAVEQFLGGVVDPLPRTEGELTVTAGPEDDPQVFVDLLIGGYWQQVEDVYFTTR